MTSSGPNVNKPTDVKQKESDVNRKLQIYGIVSAFQIGKVPSVCFLSIFPKPSCIPITTLTAPSL